MADLNDKTVKNVVDKAQLETPQINPIIRRDNEEYKIIKKLPKRFPIRQNDVYITNKTDFKAQLQKCNHILFEKPTNKAENEANEIVLHAIGPAINRAINLALKLEQNKKCTVNCYTSTIVLEDDLLPLMDHLEISFQHRNLSSVHIKIKSK